MVINLFAILEIFLVVLGNWSELFGCLARDEFIIIIAKSNLSVTSLENHWFYKEVVRFRVMFLWAQTEELKKRGYKIERIFWFL